MAGTSDVLQDVRNGIGEVLQEFADTVIRAEVERIVEDVRTQTEAALRDVAPSTPDTPDEAPAPKRNGTNGNGGMSRADVARTLSEDPRFKARGNLYGDLARLERKGLIHPKGHGRDKRIDPKEAVKALETLVS